MSTDQKKTPPSASTADAGGGTDAAEQSSRVVPREMAAITDATPLSIKISNVITSETFSLENGA